ncbi:MAG: tRNA(Ile)(2)-agmatinylcytidine synthase [Methanobacteriaceae archaeon]|nr:tRNA(Ile)(2)-agmatinylcytidine synthase [Methanobacteriaceae archaeon]
MIIINYLYVGIDDTDSNEGMCTSYLASYIINKLKENDIKIVNYPRLIRLNPFAQFKTRGNGAISFKILNDNKTSLAKKIILEETKNFAMLDSENTNPGVVFYNGQITNELVDYSIRAINSIITIEEAEKFANRICAEIHKFKNGRGIIGALAAIAFPLKDFTYELLTYRVKNNYGKKRKINKGSVLKMDQETYPDTFENYDMSEDYIAIEPKTPCPVLYGIRSNTIDALKKAEKIVKVDEDIYSACIFKTNQHTDAHIQEVNNIADLNQFSCYKFKGTVRKRPTIIEGGHVFFHLFDKTGEIECGAYEPTKDFRKIILKLHPGDIIEVYGGIGKHNTFNIEKFKVIKLNKIKYINPKCECGRTLSSAGKNKGFKCKKCGFKIKSGKKIAIDFKRDLEENKLYETPISARRHLAKPICRMDI